MYCLKIGWCNQVVTFTEYGQPQKVIRFMSLLHDVAQSGSFFKSISSSMVLWCPLRTIQKQWVSTSNPIPPKTKQKRKMFTLELQNAGVVQPPPALRFPLLPWNFCVKVVCDWMTCWHPYGSQCGYPRSVRRFREQQCLNEVLFLELMMNFHNQLSNESFNMCCRIDDHVGRFYWRDLEAIFTFFFGCLKFLREYIEN